MSKQDQVARMASKTGEDKQERPTFVVPELKFNGSSGEFSIITREEVDGEWMKNEEQIDDPVYIVPLRTRSKLFKYNKKGGQEILMWTNEYNHKGEIVQLWKKDVGGVEVIDEGGVDDLRDRHDLSSSYQEVVYCLVDGDIHSFTIKGSNLGNWWDTKTEISNDDLHPFLVDLKVTKHKEDGGPMTYYQMDFDYQAHEKDLDEIEEHLDTLDKNFKALDDYVKSQLRSNSESLEDVQKEFEGDGIDYPEDEDITPEDIPF